MFNHFRFLFALLTCLTTFSSLNAIYVELEDTSDSAIQEMGNSVRDYKDGKIYLNTEYLHLQDDQILLQIGVELFPVEALHSDGNGCYIPVRQGGIPDLSWKKWQCNNCGRQWSSSPFSQDSTRCGNCGSKNIRRV